MTPEREERLQKIRNRLRDGLGLPATLGYGPRYLHSTGQLHKGGPGSGLFIVLTTDVKEDVPIPGERYTFGALLRAQALGDFHALGKRGRRVIRIHLVDGMDEGLARLAKLVSGIS
jgi:hypothetical protein